MGRFKHDDVSHYGGQGGAGFFSLQNDGDVKKVRFLYDSIDDVDGFAVHAIDIDGRKRYVNCLRDYNEPLDKCPFCREHRPQTVRLFVPLYDVEDGKVKMWERGKKFFAKLSSLCSRYPNLVAHEFEIERNGVKGDTNTTYEIYPVSDDDSTLEDFPEVPDVLGTMVLDKSAEDMEYYLESGEFPPEEDDVPVRRRSRSNDDYEDEPAPRAERREARRDERTTRRTPATARRRGRTEEF